MTAPPPLADPQLVRDHLIAAARSGTTLTYSALLAHLGYAFSRPKMRALCATLSAVDRDGASRGEPELAVLVVRQSDGLPGQGWWVGETARARSYHGPWEGPQAARFIRQVQSETFAFHQCQNGTATRSAAD